MLKEWNCLEQTCQLQNKNVHWGYKNNEISKMFYKCEIKNINITIEEGSISTNSLEHSEGKTDNDVNFFSYDKNCTIKIIPNSIFQKFPNLEWFLIEPGCDYENLTPNSFKNAKNLKTIDIAQNNIEEIGSGIFVEAPNLEIIILQKNKIRMIHNKAFEGLSKLKFMTLDDNQILFIYPQTFSGLFSLQYLFLNGNKCLDKTFEEFGNFTEIEHEIEENCEFKFCSMCNSATTVIKTTNMQNLSFLSKYFMIYLIICKIN